MNVLKYNYTKVKPTQYKTMIQWVIWCIYSICQRIMKAWLFEHELVLPLLSDNIDILSLWSRMIKEIRCYEAKTEKTKGPAVRRQESNPGHTPLAWAASALPLSHDSQTTTNPHNPLLHVLTAHTQWLPAVWLSHSVLPATTSLFTSLFFHNIKFLSFQHDARCSEQVVWLFTAWA